MEFRAFLLAIPLLCFSAVSMADFLETHQQKLSYVIGTLLGKNLNNQGAEIDIESLSVGLQDFLTGKELKIDEENAKKILKEFQEMQTVAYEELAKKNKSTEIKFLAKNETKEEVQTNVTGLQYIVIEEGEGKSPNRTAKVILNYISKLLDGTIIENTYEQNSPQRMSVYSMIPGLQVALPMMKEGAKWQLFIPSDMAYRKKGRLPDIGPNETLIYEIELVSVGMH